MASTLTLLLCYIACWVIVTLAASRMVKGSKRVTVNPFIVMIRLEKRFERLERLRENRIIGYILDIGFIALTLSAAWFYWILIRRLLLELAGLQTRPLLVPIIPGLTISLETFLYLLPGLSLGIILHEFMHALAARFEGIRVKFVGFLVALGVLPAAFVEPEEEELERAPLRSKLRIYSAGVLANIILALVALALIQLYTAGTSYIYLINVESGSPASKAGLSPGILISDVTVNGTSCGGYSGFIACMYSLASKYNGTANIALNITFQVYGDGKIRVFKPRGVERIGITFIPAPSKLVDMGLDPKTAYVVYTTTELGFAINLGLALINSVPLFITDGAQALRAILARYMGEEKAAMLTVLLSTLTLMLILPSIYLPL